MRNVAILYLAPDKAVDNFLTRLRAQQSSWREVAAFPVGGEPSSLARAVEMLSHKNGEFDTLLFVTHGREDGDLEGEVQFRARTAVSGDVIRSNAYLLAEELAPVLGERVALVAATCFSNHDEFHEAMERLLPAYAIAGVGELEVPKAVDAILTFLRVSQPFPIEDLGQIHEDIVEKVRDASGGQMAAWLPGGES